MRRLCMFISVTVCFMLITTPGHTQDPDDEPPELSLFNYPQSWITAGAGLGAGLGSGYNASAGASVNMGLPWRGLVAQAALSTARSVHDFSEHATSVSTAAGTTLGSQDYALVFVAGPAVTWGSALDDGKSFLVPGITLNTQFLVLPSMVGGAGLDFTVNLTPEQSTMGVRFVLMIGSPRPPAR